MGLQPLDFLGASTENVIGLTSSFGIDAQPDPPIKWERALNCLTSGELDKAGPEVRLESPDIIGRPAYRAVDEMAN